MKQVVALLLLITGGSRMAEDVVWNGFCVDSVIIKPGHATVFKTRKESFPQLYQEVLGGLEMFVYSES